MTPQPGDLATNVGFVTTLPAQLRISTPYIEGGTCANAAAATSGTAGGTTITVAGLNIPAYDPLNPGAGCTVFVDVVQNAGALNGSCSPPPAGFTVLPGNIVPSAGSVTVNALTSSCLTVGTFPALMPPAVRQGQGGLNCTANDVETGNINVVGTTQCIFGQPTTLNLTADIITTSSERYDIGIFFSGDGNNLLQTPGNGGATFASALTLTQPVGSPPPSPNEIINIDGDACLDTTSGTVSAYPLGLITITCTPNPTTGFLDLVSLVTWNQNSLATDCGGPQDVNTGTKSKCTSSTDNTTVAVVGQINITKQTIPDMDPTVFNFTAANTTTPASAPTPTAFPLSDNLTQLVQTAQLTQAGQNYLITETIDPNFVLTSIVCTDGAGMPAPNTTINLVNGTVVANMSTTNGIVNCTYTNTRKSFLTVNKVISPASDPGLFNLTANATTVNNQSNGGTTGPVEITAAVAAPVSEAAGTGTALGSYTTTYACIDALTMAPITSGNGTSIPGGVTAAQAQSIVCTFTNTRNPSVTVVKSLVPTSDPGLFNLTAGATTVNNQSNGGTATTAAVTGTPVLAQETAGTGTSLANYSTTYSCNDEAGSAGSGTQVTVTPTTNVPAVTCTFTNTRLTNVVTLNKVLSPGGDPGLFNLIINGTTVATDVGNGGTGNIMTIPVGSTVTIAEAAGTGTNLVNYNTLVSCAPAAVTPGMNNQSGTFTMPNAPVTCNFNNTRKQIAVTLQKTWVNAAVDDQVTINAGTHQFISVATVPSETDVDMPFGVDAGSTISITETFNVGSAASYGSNLQCSGNSVPLAGNQLTVTASDPPITCTFTNTLLVQPALTKSFNPTSILSGGTTVLTFTVTNPPTGSTRTVTFTDTLPSGLQLANGTVGGNGVCGAFTATDAADAALVAGSTSVKVTGLTINAGQTCTVTVNVTNKLTPSPQLNTDCTMNPPAFTNAAVNISGLTNLDNLVQPSCLIVSTLPTLTKLFSPTTITVGGTTVLTFTVDNTQAGSLARSGLTFTDALPSSLQLADGTVGGTCTGFTITDSANAVLAAGSTSVKVTNLAIAQNASCTITVNVTNVPQQTNASCAANPAAFTNTSGSISALTDLVNGVQPSCVVVNPLLPVLVKSFNPTTISVGGTTTLTFTVTNPAANPALSNVSYIDVLPAGLQIANPNGVGGTCANAVAATAAVAGTGTITITNLQVAAGPASCTVTVNVTNVPLSVNPSCVGDPPNFTNAAGNVTSTSVDNQILPSCVVVNPLTPSLNKAFNPTTINVGGTTTLTFTVTNPAAFNPAQQVSFVDTLPLGLQVAAVPNVGGTCTGGSVSAPADGNTITVAGVTVGASNAASSTCTVTVDITNVPQQSGTCPAANFTNTATNISGILNITNDVTDSCVNVIPLIPSMTKAFNPTQIFIGGTTTLTFTITNPAANNPAQVFSFTDTLPAGLLVAAVPNIGGTCTGGTVTATGGTNSIAVASVIVPASTAMSSSCTITVDVTNAPFQTGVCPNANFTNSAGNLSGVDNVNTTSVVPSCVTVLPLTPSLNKAFSPNVIDVGGTTTLTFTVTNPAGNPALANVGFVDTLPSGLIVQTPNGVGGTCVNAAAATTAVAGSGTITVANLQVPAGASSCTVTVNVTNAVGQTNPSCAANPAAFTNVSGNVTVTNVTNDITPSCVVVNPLAPTLTKSFSPTTINVGGTTTLTFTVTNPAGNPALTNVGFVDTLPAGLIVQNPNGVGGTCVNAAAATTAVAGSGTITVANLQVPAGASSCTVTVNITNAVGQSNPSCGANPANFTNTSANVTVTNVINGIQPSCVVVLPLEPTLTKSFSPTTINVGGTTTLTFTVTNPAGNPALSNVGFVDTLPVGLIVQSPNGVGGTCANAVAATTAVAGSGSISVANLQVPAGASSCTVTVNITNAVGQTNTDCSQNPVGFTNTSANVAVTNVINGVQPSCVIVNPLTPTLTKSFSPTVIALGGTTTLTFTVTNPANNPALSNVSFTDTLPSGLVIQNPNGVGGTCANAAAATTAVSGTGTITVTNLQVPAGASSCTVTVNVTNAQGQANPSCASLPAAFTNTSGNVTVTNVSNGVQPSCVVVQTFSFTITKTASAGTVSPGSPLSFTIVITNNGPAAADGSIITDPAIANYAVSGVSCVQTTGGASCPTPLTVVALQGAGMTVATFPAGASITLQVDGTTDLANGSLVNTVTVSPPAGIPGVASASASASVSAQIGVIPTLSIETLIALMLMMAGLAGVAYRRKAKQR